MNGQAGEAIPPLQLDWQGHTPRHPRYQDIYGSEQDRLAEARHVFLAGNALPERFAGGGTIRVGELGFGSGLNLLATCASFAAAAPPTARLSYVAVEAEPMSGDQMRRALAPWPELDDWRERLIRALPPRRYGLHRCRLSERIELILLYGPVQQALNWLANPLDAWLLDGFAPARNPQMWAPEVCRHLAQLSRPGATLASYSVAGTVRRNLQAAGFALTKTAGYGRKREMLCGRIDRPSPRVAWHAWPETRARHVAVIGAGIAGCCQARALAEAGLQVTLFDTGSHNRIPVLSVRSYPERTASLSRRLHDRAWVTARSFYTDHCPDALQTDTDRDCAVLSTDLARAQLLSHPAITIHASPCPPGANFDATVSCTGAAPGKLDLPLRPAAGASLALDGPVLARPEVGGHTHALPTATGLLLGSTYHPGRRQTGQNPATLAWQLLAAAPERDLRAVRALRLHSGLRWTTPDHLPVIGPWPELDAWNNDADLRHGRALAESPSLRPGHWLNLAHGSRGATVAPLAATLITAALTDQVIPLETDLLAAIHPGRFAVRALRRGQR